MFHYFKWNDYALNDYLASVSDFEEVLIKCGAKVPFSKVDNTCPVCLNSDAEIVFECGHKICKECLNQYLTEKLRTTSFINCFYLGCKSIIPYSFYNG